MINIKKTLLSFSLLLILIICFGFVSASEDVDKISECEVDLDSSIEIQSVENSIEEGLDEVEGEFSNENTENILKYDLVEKDNITSNSLEKSIIVDGSSGSDIQRAISSANHGDTIILSGGYDVNQRISVTRRVNIVGEGETILNCENNVDVFYYEYYFNNTSFKNLKFLNSYCAVRNHGNYVTFINCTFLNGSHAIEWYGNNVTLINCSFINLGPVEHGGAVRVGGHATLINCSFVNNTASKSGGAVYMGDYATLINCSFINNTAKDYGGAIYLYGYLNSLVNCTFVDNKAENSGAVYVDVDEGHTNFTNCTFLNNTAFEKGGAVLIDGNNTLLTNCIFNQNYATQGCSIFVGFNNDVILNGSYFYPDDSSNILSIGNLRIIKLNANLSFYLGNLSFYYKTPEEFTFLLKDNDISLSNRSVDFYLDDDRYLGSFKTDNNGFVTLSEGLDNLAVGIHTLNATFESFTYDLSNLQISFEVLDNVETELSVSDVNVAYNYGLLEVFLSYDGNPIKNKEIDVQIADKTFKIITNYFGVASFDIGKLNLENGNYTAYLNFPGSGDYNPSEANCTVRVNNEIPHIPKINSSLAISIENLGINKVKIDLTLTDENGAFITDNISVVFNNVEYIVEVLNGKCSLNLTNLIPNDYAIFAYYKGNEDYYSTFAHSQFKISKLVTSIEYNDMVTTAVDTDTNGRVGENFTITLKDNEGRAVANKKVLFGFNGKIYEKETNASGKAQLQINLKRADIYTFAVCFLGDDGYNGSFAVAKITVNKQKPILTVPAKAYKANAKTKALTATFKSSRGKPVKDKKVSFTVNGKTYTATTNEKGVATVNVSLNKKGTYSFTAKFAGDNTYAAISKSAKLTIK